MTSNYAYWKFYLDGRDDRRLRNEIDIDAIAAKAWDATEPPSGVLLRQLIAQACEAAAAPLDTTRSKNRWLSDHEAEIKEDGLDEQEAYRVWRQGRIDELAYALEEQVLQVLMGLEDSVTTNE